MYRVCTACYDTECYTQLYVHYFFSALFAFFGGHILKHWLKEYTEPGGIAEAGELPIAKFAWSIMVGGLYLSADTIKFCKVRSHA